MKTVRLSSYSIFRLAFLLTLLLVPLAGRAQEACPDAAPKWYASLPVKAERSEDGASMKIGGKTYRVYNAFDPIAPNGGERVIDFAGVLDYYMWVHKAEALGGFAVSRIDADLDIYYYDSELNEYVSPRAVIPQDRAGQGAAL
jgi:hypothetical protein